MTLPPGIPRLLTVPDESAMFDLLTGLNVSGEHPELPCVQITPYGTAPFLATLTDPDADRVNYIASDDTGRSQCSYCENCGHAATKTGDPSMYPVTVLVGRWPDADRCREDDINPWWLDAHNERRDVDALVNRLVEMHYESDIDGHGDEGAGYDYGKFYDLLLAEGWTPPTPKAGETP